MYSQAYLSITLYKIIIRLNNSIASRRHALEGSYQKSKFTTTTGKSVELRRPEVCNNLFKYQSTCTKISSIYTYQHLFIFLIKFLMFHVQHKNNGPHISHRNKGSTSDRHEQILTPILDMSPTTDRIVDQRKLRKAKSQVRVFPIIV